MTLARALAQRWGATIDGGVIDAKLDGMPFRAHVTEDALVELTLDAVDVPTFELSIAPRRDPDEALEWASLSEYVGYRGARRPNLREEFLRGFAVTTTDRELTRLWIDDPAREALLAAPERYTLAGGAVTVAPFAAIGLDGFERTVRAAAHLVTRPQRLAASWRQTLAPIVAADVSDDWGETGLSIVIRGAAELRIDTPWVPHAGESKRLRTRIRARRFGGRDRWALWRHSLDDADQPARADGDVPVTLPGLLGDRYAAWMSSGPPLIQRLGPIAPRIAHAAPDVMACEGDRITLWWRGLILDPRRLAPALGLVGAIANDGAQLGPYR